MSKYDILLVHPYAFSPKTRFAPIGLLSLASQLDAAGLSTKLLDLQLLQDSMIDTLRDLGGRLNPDLIAKHKEAIRGALKDLREDGIVGFGGASEGRFQVFNYSRYVKELLPESKVIYGGPHATFTGELTLKKITSIDIIVHNEGEITLAELVEYFFHKKKNLRDIKGISYRGGKDIHRNPPRKRIRNLDSLVYNFSKFIDLNDYQQDFLLGKRTGKAFNFITSRGCIAKCNFCAASALWHGGISAHSARRVVDEIEKLIEENCEIKGILFVDSLLTFSRTHVLSICQEIERRKLNFSWTCGIRSNSVDYDLLEQMKQAGCYSVNFGFESASPRILNEVIGKKVTVNDALRVFEWVEALDMNVIINVTWGHPTETYDEALYTMDFLMDKLNDHVHMLDPQPMRIYPGTMLEKYAINNKLLPPGFDWCSDYDFDPGLKRSTPYVPILIQPQLGIVGFRQLIDKWDEIAKDRPCIFPD